MEHAPCGRSKQPKLTVKASFRSGRTKMSIIHSRNRTGIPAESSIPQPSHASRRGSAATPGKGQRLQRVKTCSGSDCACPTLTQARLDLAQRRSPARFGAARGSRRDWPRLKGAASELRPASRLRSLERRGLICRKRQARAFCLGRADVKPLGGWGFASVLTLRHRGIPVSKAALHHSWVHHTWVHDKWVHHR